MSGYGVVLVGVDGSAVSGTALEFAADEAHRRRAGLVIAHAGTSASVDPQAVVERFAEIVCREAVASIAARHPDLDSHTVMRVADPGALLVELAASADLLVVGTHRTARLRGWVLGSVSQYVAAHADCPVVAITSTPAHDAGPVVLGASASPGGLAALRFACEEARVRNVAVHAIRSVITEDWALSGPGYAAVIGPDVMHDAARAELDKVLSLAEEEYPDVSLSGDVSTGNPFLDLLKAADAAALLVVGSRRGTDAVLPHLGPVAAWLLHQAACPLAVVGFRER